ncbi:MAG: dTMP kinase [Candidatus Marinimicrobia bacterium]|nr:dTMP kinase [Candidatus Neomarinimicrobiota bacterium]
MTSRLISFEGIDGSGKSTQINLLSEWMTEKNIEFQIVREPGGTSISERIREILLDKKNLHLNHESESFLFLSARAQLVNEVIRPALKSGKFVICDRFIDSTLAYQGYGRGLDLTQLEAMNSFAIGECIPSQTFLLDVDIESSIQRRSGTEDDRMESVGIEFLRKVREGYVQLSIQFSNRIILLDSTENKGSIFNKIKAQMCNIYGELNE